MKTNRQASGSKWLRRAFILGVVLVASVVLLRNYASPTVRDDIACPLYTIGDTNYEKALQEGKSIIKFGRLAGVYSGGRAFDDIGEAYDFIAAQGKDKEGWKVYRLSGDFDLDTVEVEDSRFTVRSLLVVELVPRESF